MSTAMTVYDKNKFLSLSDSGEAAEAMAAMRETGETFGPGDLIRIKSPAGGGLSWMVPTADGEKPVREIVGALVHYQRCGLLWPSEEMTTGQQPVLRSWDMVVGEQVGPIPDDLSEVLEEYRINDENGRPTNRFHVAESSGFPYNQWGSGRNGIGKRFIEQRMLFVLPAEEIAPYLITVGVGSLKTVGDWFRKLPQVAKVPWHRVVVGLSLQPTTSKSLVRYSQIVARTAGILDRETGAALKRMWGDTLSRVAKQVDVGGGDNGDDE